MSGWMSVLIGDWQDVVVVLVSSGLSWPESMAKTDLCWHVATGRPIPGCRQLAPRWGWSERRVRALVEDASWRDLLRVAE